MTVSKFLRGYRLQGVSLNKSMDSVLHYMKLYPKTIGNCTSPGFWTGVTHKVSEGERKFEVGLQGSGFACCS